MPRPHEMPPLDDTDPEAARIQREIIARMTPAERLRKVCELNQAVETLAKAGIREMFPNASEREVFLRLAVRNLGLDLARRVYPEIDRLEDLTPPTST